MISVADQNILLCLNTVLDEIIIDDGPEKNKIREVVAQFNIKKKRSCFQEGQHGQSHMYTGIQIKIEQTPYEVHSLKITKLFITLGFR